MTDKKQWGGKRPNQTGRPPNRPGVKRIGFHCMVDPATKDLITRQAAKTKSSAGQVVDELAKGLMEFKKCKTKDDIENDPRVKELFLGSTHGMTKKWYADLKSGFWSQESETTTISANAIADICFYLNEDVVIDPRPKGER